MQESKQEVTKLSPLSKMVESIQVYPVHLMMKI